MQWKPVFDTLLLEHGDDTAVHFGAKGGLRPNEVVAAPEPAPVLSGSETQWLHSNGIDWE
jgi:hypothetical protein